jgi:hypothetical protein
LYDQAGDGGARKRASQAMLLAVTGPQYRKQATRPIRALVVLASALFMGLFSAPVLPWGKGGHMMAGHIAYERLNPRAKEEADRLLAIPLPLSEGADFVRAGYWADEVRARMKQEYGYSGPYHYIDYPFTTDGTPLPANLPEPENIVRALDKYVAVLRSPVTTDDSKAEALRFVIHFVADAHQPLHAVSRVTHDHPLGDEGGNLFPIEDKATPKDPRYNLHKYWDNGMEKFPRMGPDYAAPPMEEIPGAAAKAVASNPESSTEWRKGGAENYAGWAMESSRVAREFVYRGIQENHAPSSNYERHALRIAEQRIAWAGYRLARLLNEIWK